MKLHLANYQPDKLGGGWSFSNSFAKGLGDKLVSYEEADIYFIAGPTMASYDDVQKAKEDGKKVVLRVDNIVRNSRNRNTGMSRMKAFAEAADLVIYQSEYARQTLGLRFLEVDGPVILNGCDQSIFNPKGREETVTARYMYSRVNRDETKNWEMARFAYSVESQLRDYDTILNLVGQFSPELLEYDFDFYLGEPYRYWGVLSDPGALAAIYRNSDYLIYTFWNDACSNTLIEALSCGCEIYDPYGMLDTGGAPDIMQAFAMFGREYFSHERMTKEYLEVIGE